MPDPVLSRRGRLNALQRYHGADHPAVREAERELRAERLAEHARQVVADWPVLTPEQRDRIAALLRPTVGGGGG